MAERPYTLLSCSMSIDGYIDGASESRLLLSNDLDFDRGRPGPRRRRRDHGRGHDGPQRRPAVAGARPRAARAATLEGPARDPGQGHRDRARPPRPVGALLRRRRHRKLVYAAAAVVGGLSAGSALRPRSSTVASRCGCAHWPRTCTHRGVRAAHGGRRGRGAHAVPRRRPGRRAPARGGAVLRRRGRAPGDSSGRATSPGIPAAEPCWPRPSRCGDVCLLRYALSDRYDDQMPDH